MERATKLGSLNNIKGLGFYPQTIIDVGAQTGTHCLYQVFPDSHHILIEPVEENEVALKQEQSEESRIHNSSSYFKKLLCRFISFP